MSTFFDDFVSLSRKRNHATRDAPADLSYRTIKDGHEWDQFILQSTHGLTPEEQALEIKRLTNINRGSNFKWSTSEEERLEYMDREQKNFPDLNLPSGIVQTGSGFTFAYGTPSVNPGVVPSENRSVLPGIVGQVENEYDSEAPLRFVYWLLPPQYVTGNAGYFTCYTLSTYKSLSVNKEARSKYLLLAVKKGWVIPCDGNRKEFVMNSLQKKSKLRYYESTDVALYDTLSQNYELLQTSPIDTQLNKTVKATIQAPEVVQNMTSQENDLLAQKRHDELVNTIKGISLQPPVSLEPSTKMQKLTIPDEYFVKFTTLFEKKLTEIVAKVKPQKETVQVVQPKVVPEMDLSGLENMIQKFVEVVSNDLETMKDVVATVVKQKAPVNVGLSKTAIDQLCDALKSVTITAPNITVPPANVTVTPPNVTLNPTFNVPKDAIPQITTTQGPPPDDFKGGSAILKVMEEVRDSIKDLKNTLKQPPVTTTTTTPPPPPDDKGSGAVVAQLEILQQGLEKVINNNQTVSSSQLEKAVKSVLDDIKQNNSDPAVVAEIKILGEKLDKLTEVYSKKPPPPPPPAAPVVKVNNTGLQQAIDQLRIDLIEAIEKIPPPQVNVQPLTQINLQPLEEAIEKNRGEIKEAMQANSNFLQQILNTLTNSGATKEQLAKVVELLKDIQSKQVPSITTTTPYRKDDDSKGGGKAMVVVPTATFGDEFMKRLAQSITSASQQNQVFLGSQLQPILQVLNQVSASINNLGNLTNLSREQMATILPQLTATLTELQNITLNTYNLVDSGIDDILHDVNEVGMVSQDANFRTAQIMDVQNQIASKTDGIMKDVVQTKIQQTAGMFRPAARRPVDSIVNQNNAALATQLTQSIVMNTNQYSQLQSGGNVVQLPPTVNTQVVQQLSKYGEIDLNAETPIQTPNPYAPTPPLSLTPIGAPNMAPTPPVSQTPNPYAPTPPLSLTPIGAPNMAPTPPVSQTPIRTPIPTPNPNYGPQPLDLDRSPTPWGTTPVPTQTTSILPVPQVQNPVAMESEPEDMIQPATQTTTNVVPLQGAKIEAFVFPLNTGKSLMDQTSQVFVNALPKQDSNYVLRGALGAKVLSTKKTQKAWMDMGSVKIEGVMMSKHGIKSAVVRSGVSLRNYKETTYTTLSEKLLTKLINNYGLRSGVIKGQNVNLAEGSLQIHHDCKTPTLGKYSEDLPTPVVKILTGQGALYRTNINLEVNNKMFTKQYSAFVKGFAYTSLSLLMTFLSDMFYATVSYSQTQGGKHNFLPENTLDGNTVAMFADVDGHEQNDITGLYILCISENYANVVKHKGEQIYSGPSFRKGPNEDIQAAQLANIQKGEGFARTFVPFEAFKNEDYMIALLSQIASFDNTNTNMSIGAVAFARKTDPIPIVNILGNIQGSK